MTQEEYQGRMDYLLKQRRDLISSINTDSEEAKAAIRKEQKDTAVLRQKLQIDMEGRISRIKAEREQKRRAKETELSQIKAQIGDLKFQMYNVSIKKGVAV